MSRHGDHRHLAHTGLVRDFLQERTDYHARLHNVQQHRTIHADALQQRFFKTARALVHHPGSGGLGIFAHLFPGQHIGQQVRHEEDLLRFFQRGVSLLRLRVQLENGIKIHDLDARHPVQFLTRHLLENFLRNSGGVRVPIRSRQSQDTSIRADMAEIHPPGVDADRIDLHAPAGNFLQGCLQVAEQAVDIPEKLPVLLLDGVGETIDLLHGEILPFKSSDNGTARSGAQVKCQKTMYLFHIGVNLRNNSD